MSAKTSQLQVRDCGEPVDPDAQATPAVAILFRQDFERLEFADHMFTHNALAAATKPVSAAKCNHELGCLHYTLRLAVKEGLREVVSLVKPYKQHGTRDRVLSEEKY
jgi:hypothetical protein